MRLIDADELLTAFPYDDEPTVTKSSLRMTIKHMPTIDTVEVVRCKDCKWRGHIGCAITIVDESDEPKDDDFCSWGERREDETN